ncbi:MAG TPA: 16S rRNA (cytidine(1402)-2'-O)-methyltransferase [Gemmatimonadales bacterium]|nr:16S rRNA (cytidine(1402)-2'-O)-methyltransferase [Gemmatimonadales bacterium]
MAGELVGAPGTLYIVATPLGNLGDLSARAAEILRTVPVVAAEDTRVTRGLLTHLGARPRLLALHQHSGADRVAQVVDRLAAGEDIAYVTDAGTPGVSDPGPVLVAAVRARGLLVVPIPGPSAVATALSASGLPADQYLFLGFPPRRGPERDRWLRRATTPGITVVCFEAPGRVEELLTDLAAGGHGERPVCVARELTKLHEEFRVGTLTALAAQFTVEPPPKGEVTLVLGPLPERATGGADADAARALAQELLAAGRSTRDVIREVTDRTGLPRNTVYDLVTHLAKR